MPATVIVIGFNPNNRLQPAQTDPGILANSIDARGPCSPDCIPTSNVVLGFDPTLAGGAGDYQIFYDNASLAKPAEIHVLHFSDATRAKAWLQAQPRTTLLGKSIYLIDPSTLETAASMAAQASRTAKQTAKAAKAAKGAAPAKKVKAAKADKAAKPTKPAKPAKKAG